MFDLLEQTFRSDGPEAVFGLLIQKARDSQDHRMLFGARIMQVRHRTGLPLIETESALDLAGEQRTAYETAFRDAAREAGGLCLAARDIPSAWAYFKAIGEPAPVAAAIENVTTGEGACENVDRVMRDCVGGIVIGLPRWTTSSDRRLVSEFNQYEGAAAVTHGLALLILAEEGVEERAIVWTGGGKIITKMPADADAAWVDGDFFKQRFALWQKEIAERRDVFLGYCSASSGIAAYCPMRWSGSTNAEQPTASALRAREASSAKPVFSLTVARKRKGRMPASC